MLKRILMAVFVAAIPAVLLAQTPEQFDDLKDPRISTKKDAKMLVVEAEGDPNVMGAKAFGLVFRLYYSSPDTPKGPMQSAPRARWPVSFDDPKAEWTGLYALPVPESMTELPKHEPQKGLKASLVTWEYGEVVEILHVGPYDKEEPTVKRLKEFVEKQGYVIAGDHEEEYIKGPDMYGKGDPEKYLTIIRYQVKKVEK